MLTWALATIFIVAAKNKYELEINGGLLYFAMMFDVAIAGLVAGIVRATM